MINFTLNLLLLSLIFSIFGVAALLFRHKYLHGKGSVMYFVWLPVLILSVIPLRLCPSISISGNVDIDNILQNEAQTSSIHFTGEEQPAASGYSLKEIKLTLINNVSEIDPVERINALYAVQPRIIGREEAFGAAALLEKTGSYIYPLFFTLTMVWVFGAISSFASSIIDYRKINERLKLYSTVYYDAYDGGRLGEILSTACKRTGIRRRVVIRLVDWQAAVSPCVSGLLHPVIYIGEDIARIDSNKLELILAHELVHCRRCDVIYKMAVLLVSSVHWYNGLSKIIARAVNEDCELSCDSCVLALYGQEKSDFYMMTILDIAENYCRSAYQRARSSGLAEGMYLSGYNGKSFLKRRYVNMKNNNEDTKRRNTRSTAILLVLCLILNVLIMSACGVGAVKSDAGAQNMINTGDGTYVMNPVSAAIYNYFGVPDVLPLEKNQLEEVKSIDVRLYKGVPVIFINESFQPPYNTIISSDSMEQVRAVIEAYAGTDNYSLYDDIFSFYTLKDINDPLLTVSGVNEMLELFPYASVVATYIFDPYASFKEICAVSSIYEQLGFYINIEKTEAQMTEFVEAYILDNGLKCEYSVMAIDPDDTAAYYNIEYIGNTIG